MHLVPRLGSGIPLVARTHEMRRLRAAFARAERGEAGAVLLSGDAGVGKTRLLTALGEHVEACGGLVLTGRCIDVREGGLPYLPFAEALAPLGNSADPAVAAAVRLRPALGRLLPQGQGLEAPRPAEHPPMTSNDRETMVRPRPEQDLGQLQLFDAVLGVLTEISESRPVVILLEDLHWADASTRNLLSFLLSRLRAQRLLVVGSYREEDVHRRHPLRGLLSELVRLATVERVDLQPFGDADARRFVEALADEPLPADVVADIVTRSEGNPFFAEELLATKTECNDLPAGLAEVLLSRFERLSPDTRRVARVDLGGERAGDARGARRDLRAGGAGARRGAARSRPAPRPGGAVGRLLHVPARVAAGSGVRRPAAGGAVAHARGVRGPDPGAAAGPRARREAGLPLDAEQRSRHRAAGVAARDGRGREARRARVGAAARRAGTVHLGRGRRPPTGRRGSTSCGCCTRRPTSRARPASPSGPRRSRGRPPKP